MSDQNSVNEQALQGLFKSLVDDLVQKLRDGDATGKDKDLAYKMVQDFKIGITLDDAEPLEALALELPFNEMRHQ